MNRVMKKCASVFLAIGLGIGLVGCTANDETASTEETLIMFHGDAAHSGATDTKGVEQAKGIKWSFASGGRIVSSPIVTRDTIYFGSDDQYLYAVDLNGKEKWKFKAEDAVRSTPAIKNSIIYFGDIKGNLYAVDRTKEKLVWQKKTNMDSKNYDQWDYFRSSPIIWQDLVLFASDGQLLALKATNGKEIWTYRADNEHTLFHSSPAASDGMIYVTSMSGDLIAIDANTGKQVWIVNTKQPIQASPMVYDGIVYIGGRDTKFHAFDAKTGEELWKFMTPSASWITSSAAIANGTVYVGTSDDLKLLALDAKTGQKKWQFYTDTHIFSSPTYVNGTIYFGTGYAYFSEKEEYLYAVNAATGVEQWKVKIGKTHSTPAVYDGVIYITSTDGLLYAVE